MYRRKLNAVNHGSALLALVCVLAFLAPTYAYGSLISGSQLNISGDGSVGATFLNWACDAPGGPACPANTGNFAITSSTLTFAQYNGTFGFAKDLNSVSQPLNTPFSLPNFITFALNNNESIELTFIPLGTDTPSATCAALTHCTPEVAALVAPSNPLGLSSFNLDQNGTGTSATFGIRGIIHDIGGGTGQLTGIYTAQFDNQTPSGVLALFAGAGANGLASTYSAQFSFTVVPEPVSLSLMGLGLLGLGLLRIRRKVNEE